MFPDLPRPLLFGHRGASLYAPENTLESFQRAVDAGAHVIETDVHMTRDGHVVAVHDPHIARTTDGTGEVRALSLAELQRLDAGYRFTDGDGFPFRGRGCRISTLAEVLEAFPRAGFNIELKQANPSLVEPTLEVLAAAGNDNVLLAAAQDGIMAELEAAGPGCALGISRGQAKSVLRGAWIGGIPAALHGRALQVPPRLAGVPLVTDRVIRRAHQAQIEIHLWTLNDVDVARRWLARGVDGIMSDDPVNLAPLF